MTAPVRIQSKRLGVWFDALPEKLSEAAAAYSLPDTPDWSPLAELSSQTLFEGIEVHGEAAVFDEGKFIAPATVYVTLQYDPKSNDSVSFHDSYPARVFFALQAGDAEKSVAVEKIEVDTTSFFAS